MFVQQTSPSLSLKIRLLVLVDSEMVGFFMFGMDSVTFHRMSTFHRRINKNVSIAVR